MKPNRGWLTALALGLMLSLGLQSEAQLSNPYTGNAGAIMEGQALWQQVGCAGCHGAKGGGGICPAVSDNVWKFGSDDETLFKLVKGDIPQQTMPAVFGQALKEDEIWKLLAYIRSLYQGPK